MNTYPLIDFHAHVLPGADHGCSGREESFRQLELMRLAGIDTVVATSHFYPNRHKPEDHLRKLAIATERLADRPSATPRICLAAEVLYCNGLEYMEQLENLCIRGTNVLLLELPIAPWGKNLFDSIYTLLRSYTVVLAHIDRYLPAHCQDIEELLSMGALAQINTDTLASFFGRRRTLPFLLDDRTVGLGSDLHHADNKAINRFMAAKNKYDAAFDSIMSRSAKLLESAETI